MTQDVDEIDYLITAIWIASDARASIFEDSPNSGRNAVLAEPRIAGIAGTFLGTPTVINYLCG